MKSQLFQYTQQKWRRIKEEGCSKAFKSTFLGEIKSKFHMVETLQVLISAPVLHPSLADAVRLKLAWK